MEQIICDKCGVRLPKLKEGIVANLLRFRSIEEYHWTCSDTHLCKGCYKKFHEWLREGWE